MELGIISLQMVIKIQPKTRTEINSQMSLEIKGLRRCCMMTSVSTENLEIMSDTETLYVQRGRGCDG